jgi:hypothetical protein
LAERIDLKEIERKAYTSCNQDGLVDIAVALIPLAFGTMMILDLPWLGGVFAFVGVSLST